MKMKKIIAAAAAMAMSVTAFTSMISASALDGAGTYTGNAAYIGTYFKSDYYGNTAFKISYKYDKFDEDGTYEDPDTGKTVTIDYNDTFQFLVFDSQWLGWDKTSVGPNGVNVTEPVLTAEDLNTTEIYTATVPIAAIESQLSTVDPVQGINLQLGGVGDTTVTLESIEYVQGEIPGEEVTIVGEWEKLPDGSEEPVGEMKVTEGSAYVTTNQWNIQVSQFSTSGFVNPTVDVTVTYDTAPNEYIQAELLNTSWEPIVANWPYVDVTGTYTYTTELPSGTNAFIACYDLCTVKEIHIYDNHEGKALNVSGKTASEVNTALQPCFAVGGALEGFEVDESGNVHASETAWGNPVLTEALFQTVKEAGFKSVRIPVSYLDMIDANGNIVKDRLDRVQKVVDDALDTGLYVIINIHNDGGEGVPGKWIDISLDHESDAFAKVVAKFSTAWTQIATRFENYNEALIFEGMNEVMISGKYSLNQFTGDELENAYANIVELNQAFVDAVRGTGDDANDDRCLIVPGYNTNIDITAYGFDEGMFYMPTDTVDDRLILSVHYYDPYDFTLNENGTATWNIDSNTDGKPYMVSQLKKIAEYGYPVYVGEYCAIFKNNISEVAEYVGAFNAAITDVVAETGVSISAAYWDNGVIGDDNKGSGIIDRRFNIVTATGTTIINAIFNNIPPKYAPVYPTPTDEQI